MNNSVSSIFFCGNVNFTCTFIFPNSSYTSTTKRNINKHVNSTRILIIDDVDINSKLLCECLVELGFINDNVSYCSNGLDAISLVENNIDRFDIIFILVENNSNNITINLRQIGYNKCIIVSAEPDSNKLVDKLFIKPTTINEIVKYFKLIGIKMINDY